MLFWLFVAVLPDYLLGGVKREDFIEFIERNIEWLSPSFEEEGTDEDAIEALKFYYTYWPDPDNPEWNRHMACRVFG